MALALYHPEYGYYTSRISAVGRRGDFSTAATLGGCLAKAIVGWIKAEAGVLKPKRLHLIELGGGNGDLANGILRSFRAWDRPQYHLVEISPRLRTLQAKVLRGWPVRWHPNVSSALGAAGGQAVLFSNEFVDAFPCRRFVRQHGQWREIFFCHDAGTWCERAHPVEAPPQSRNLDGWMPPDGQQVEVHESYRDFLAEAGATLSRGSLLTIDYGGVATETYHRRLAGSLRGYRQHQTVRGLDLYRVPGQQDLTADVNFDDLETWGSAVGLNTIRRQTQREFLLSWITGKTLSDADRFLMDEAGAGTACKVLQQRKMQ
ncbi:MAG TPA: SAM-dependent methyltransferase [Chthoniobacterales bacterium]